MILILNNCLPISKYMYKNFNNSLFSFNSNYLCQDKTFYYWFALSNLSKVFFLELWNSILLLNGRGFQLSWNLLWVCEFYFNLNKFNLKNNSFIIEFLNFKMSTLTSTEKLCCCFFLTELCFLIFLFWPWFWPWLEPWFWTLILSWF